MALGAIVAEIIGHVVGISHSVKIINVAAITIQRCILVAISMAGNTLDSQMRAG